MIRLDSGLFFVSLMFHLVMTYSTNAQCTYPDTLGRSLDNPDPQAVDSFGYAVAISGNLALVGAYNDDPAGIISAGTAYLFHALTGALLFTLNNPAPASGDSFGRAVGVSGNFAVIGAYLDDIGAVASAGAAYVFDASTGAVVSTLNNPDPPGADFFGWTVGISGSTAVVGANFQSHGLASAAGRAYVFNAITGSLVATLNNPSPTTADYFGRSVAISGNTVAVGAENDDPGGVNGAGTAYVFNAATGALISTLNNPEPDSGDGFGSHVAISGGYVVVSVPSDNSGGFDLAGTVYVFDAATGALVATLANPTPGLGDNFGAGVSVSGLTIIVGAYNDDYPGIFNGGRAFLFGLPAGNLLTTLNNPMPGGTDYFGFGVGISGNVALIGAYGDDPGGIDSAGAAFVFECPSSANLTKDLHVFE